MTPMTVSIRRLLPVRDEIGLLRDDNGGDDLAGVVP